MFTTIRCQGFLKLITYFYFSSPFCLLFWCLLIPEVREKACSVWYFERPLLYFSLIINFLFLKDLPHLLVLYKEIVLCICPTLLLCSGLFFLLYCFLKGRRSVPHRVLRIWTCNRFTRVACDCHCFFPSCLFYWFLTVDLVCWPMLVLWDHILFMSGYSHLQTFLFYMWIWYWYFCRTSQLSTLNFRCSFTEKESCNNLLKFFIIGPCLNFLE